MFWFCFGVCGGVFGLLFFVYFVDLGGGGILDKYGFDLFLCFSVLCYAWNTP